MQGDADRVRGRHGTNSVEAYELFLKGRALQYKRGRAVAQAIRCFEQASHWIRVTPRRAVAKSGDHARALGLAPSVLASSGRHIWALSLLGWVHAKVGDMEKARAVLDELEARARHEFVSPFWLAGLTASVGQLDRARAYAERAVAEREPVVLLGRVLYQWDDVRTAPWFGNVERVLWG